MLAPVSESARTDACLLLARVLDCERSWIVAHGDAAVTQAQRERFEGLCRARATGMPLAYVLGSAGFYGREFAVDARVLVPRPETEHLVEEALAFAASRNAPGGGIAALDVGTGSGAIAVTLAAENERTIVDATDTSGGAIAVARANAVKLGVSERCRFHLGPFFEPVAERRFDLVVANLPYVPSAQIPAKPNPLAFEPRRALDGGSDGLDAYRGLLPALPGVLAPGGLVLLEAAPGQMPALAAAATQAFRGARVDVARDYGGRDRYLRIEAAAFSADS
jgi:release factor glutamine methyltransferase